MQSMDPTQHAQVLTKLDQLLTQSASNPEVLARLESLTEQLKAGKEEVKKEAPAADVPVDEAELQSK